MKHLANKRKISEKNAKFQADEKKSQKVTRINIDFLTSPKIHEQKKNHSILAKISQFSW